MSHRYRAGLGLPLELTAPLHRHIRHVHIRDEAEQVKHTSAFCQEVLYLKYEVWK